eukprot:SAG22_NODE_48_length_24654_cov_4.406394_7_plen_49_part_00
MLQERQACNSQLASTMLGGPDAKLKAMDSMVPLCQAAMQAIAIGGGGH